MIALVALVSLLVCGGAMTVFVARVVSDELDMYDELQAMTEHDYPDWMYADHSRTGVIVRHRVHERLVAQVLYFRDDWPPFREGQPAEKVNDRWLTHETFFRHGFGRAPDPRTRRTYDVDGFNSAYEPLHPPDPTAWIDGVWLERVEPDGTEVYVVHVLGKAPGHRLRTDHVAHFRRFPDGTWAGEAFAPIAEE